MSLASFASKLFANSTSLLAKLLSSHELRILFPGLRYFFIASLLGMLKLLVLSTMLLPLNHPNPLLGYIESAISELSGRMLMQIDSSLSILIQSLSLNALVMLLLEVALHDAFVSTGGVCQDPQLLVHRHLFLETVHAFLLHTLHHLVGEVHFTPTELF